MSIARTSTRRDDAAPTRTRGLSLHGKVDVCRGLFAFLVVVAHGLDISWAIYPEARASLSPAARELLQHGVARGIIWVMGFFVISGYCIHLSIDRLRDEERFPLKVYLAARLSRILPLYYIGLAFAIVVEWLIAPARPWCWPNGINPSVLVSQVFVIQNLTQTFGSFAASWSITNEVVYYGFYGVLCALMAVRDGRPARAGMIICLAVAVAMQALYWTVAHTPIVLSLGMLCGLGINWFLGVLVAVDGPSLVRWRFVRVLSRLWIPLLAASLVWGAIPTLPTPGLFLISGFAFALMMVGFIREEQGRPAVAPSPGLTKWAGWLGQASYPTYLFHAPIMMLVGSAILRWGFVADWRAAWALLSAVGIASGFALGFVAEKPIMDWRSGMLRRLKAKRPAPSRRAWPAVLGAQR